MSSSNNATGSLELHSMNHISLETLDVPRLEEFYTNVMGLRQIRRPDLGFPGAWLILPNGFQQESEEHGKPPLGSVALHIIQKEPHSYCPTSPHEKDKSKTSFPQNPAAITRGPHIAFRTLDVEKVEGRLNALNINYKRNELEIEGFKTIQLFFFDPDGYGLEVGTYTERHTEFTK